MAVYLRFYRFSTSPFQSSAKKRGVVLGTQSLRGAFLQVQQGLEDATPRICLFGPQGIGKTSFCRALPKLLEREALVGIVINPQRSWEEIRAGVARKFGIEGGSLSRQALIDARPAGKRLVLVVDRAELLSHEALDHLDLLLQFKDDDDQQLLHCVMLADRDATAVAAETPLLWWLDKFNTLQLQFLPIPVEGVRHYVEKHLARAGWTGGELFTPEAIRLIHSNTCGNPAEINQLCERILIEGGIRGLTSITDEFIEELRGHVIETPEPSQRPVDTAELSADRSIGNPGTSPTAQQMLDHRDTGAAIRADEEKPDPRESMFGEQSDITSLLVTQDSPEHLQTATNALEDESSAIELEEAPHQKKFADFYQSSPRAGAPVGMTRNPASASSGGRRSGSLIVSVVALVAILWFVYSQRSVPAKLIESAEGTIEMVLDHAPKATTEPNTDRTEEPAEQDVVVELTRETSNLPPSLLDHADEILANLSHDLADTATNVPNPEKQDAGSSDETVATTPETTQGETENAERNEVAEPVDEKISSDPPSDDDPKTPAPVKPRPSEIPREMLVINEYTAIPEAASAVPKLPLPIDDGSETKQIVGSPTDSAPLGENTIETETPSMPARISSDTEVTPSDELRPEASRLDPNGWPVGPRSRRSATAK